MITIQDFTKYIDGHGVHPQTEHAKKLRQELSYHSDEDTKPREILDVVRPNELPDHKQYRLDTYEPVSLEKFNQVLGNVNKINRAQDYKWSFPEQKGTVRDGETLKDYLNGDYPIFKKFESWIFSVASCAMLKDPNSVAVTIPRLYWNDLTSTPSGDDDYLDPFTLIFDSEEVLDCREGIFCAIQSKSGFIMNEDEKGRKFLLIDKDSYGIAYEVRPDVFSYLIAPYISPQIAFTKLGSNSIKSFIDDYILYDSFLSPCLPNWREAIRRYSDHQINMALHVHPDRWEYVQSNKAESKRLIRNNAQGEQETQTPKEVPGSSNLTKTTVRPEKTMDGFIAPPTPPAGYIDKPVETLEFMRDEYRIKLKDGLNAIGLGFLEEVPLNESGTAKELDRQEVNTFFHSVASRIINDLMIPHIQVINSVRYNFLNKEQIQESNPTIRVPTNFDVITSRYFLEAYMESLEGNQDSVIITRKGLDYTKKEYGEDSEEYLIMKTATEIDPLSGKSADEKSEILLSNGCTQEDYIMSSKLYYYIKIALRDNEDFLTQAPTKKEEKVRELVEADKVLIDEARAAQVIPIEQDPDDPDED